MRVLFVCTGNTCRSPMAEVQARSRAELLGLQDLTFRSAGTAAAEGSPASLPARRVASSRGLDLSTHLSRPLTEDIVASADLIVAMTAGHATAAGRMDSRVPIILASDLLPAGHPGRGRDVLDPFGGDDPVYEASWEAIEQCVSALLEGIARKRAE